MLYNWINIKLQESMLIIGIFYLFCACFLTTRCKCIHLEQGHFMALTRRCHMSQNNFLITRLLCFFFYSPRASVLCKWKSVGSNLLRL